MKISKIRVSIAILVALVLWCLPKRSESETLWVDGENEPKVIELTCDHRKQIKKQAEDIYKILAFAAPECVDTTPDKNPECLTHFVLVIQLNNLYQKMKLEMVTECGGED